MRDNIGDFIKEQRNKNHISQNKLAETLFVDRTLISKWENNKATPCMNEIVKMSEIFNISVEEFIYGEEYNKNNKKEIQNSLNNYLVMQDNKIIKFKKRLKLFIFYFIMMLLLFFVYYFYNTYNKTIVYRLSGESDNYRFNNGLLLIANTKSYLEISNFDHNINYVTIYLKDSNKIIYEGTLGVSVIDYNGYNTSITLKTINKLIDDIYMDIYDNNGNKETLKLTVIKDFINNDVVFKDKNKYKQNETNLIDDDTPIRIKELFTCNEVICNYTDNNIFLTYNIKTKSFHIKNDNIKVDYYLSNKYIIFLNKSEVIFEIKNKEIPEENKNTYYFYKKIIDKYVYNKGSE